MGDAALGGDVVQCDLRLLQGVWPDIHQGRQVPQRGRVYQLRIQLLRPPHIRSHHGQVRVQGLHVHRGGASGHPDVHLLPHLHDRGHRSRVFGADYKHDKHNNNTCNNNSHVRAV